MIYDIFNFMRPHGTSQQYGQPVIVGHPYLSE